ncbi:MAG TPA: lysophospholipid acyltransferase family protein [Pirellulales bacterium]|jgi:1-acyl-sn-glycerol-3-phosphate acyltransferase|nr:lysophospholipid acyltransferase family protein [Pirellulales bacterium]
MAQRSLVKRLWYDSLRFILRLAGVALFQLRCEGRHHIPAEGAVLVLSNHQSHLDPPLVGSMCDRRLNFLARETLFRFPPLRWLIQSCNAIPLDREGLGLSGVKETLRRLKAGEMVLLFPEGRRTSDGEVARLKPGFCALARRSNVTLVPMAIDGAFDAWPRSQRFPRRACIHLEVGEPISPAELSKLDDRALVAEVQRRIRACHAKAREGRLRAITVGAV